MLISTIIFILILSFLVLIHELGHYVVAKWAKIKVEEFGLGYPPRAKVLFKRWDTIFSLNWIPFGGFVKMEGEDQKIGDIKKISKKTDQVGPFYEKTACKRLAVILAGVTVNFIFGVIAFAVFYSFKGIPTPIKQPRIVEVASNSPAAEAGVPINVNLIAMKADQEIIDFQSIQEAIDIIKQYRGQNITIITSGHCEGLTCQEMAQEFQVYVRTQEETPDGQGSMGVVFDSMVLHFYPWYEMPFRGVVVGMEQALFLGQLILVSLYQLFKDIFTQGHVPQEIAGPVGIVHQATEKKILSDNWLNLLNFSGILSINLAIMNLLPIPALDGGRALFIMLEKIIGRSRIAKIEPIANYGGFVLLIALLIMVTFRDIWRIFI